jgi:hypothetical protein
MFLSAECLNSHLNDKGEILQAEAAKNPAAAGAAGGAAVKEVTAAFTANVWEVHCKPGAQVTPPPPPTHTHRKPPLSLQGLTLGLGHAMAARCGRCLAT